MPFVSHSKVLREIAGVVLNKFPEMKEKEKNLSLEVLYSDSN